MNILNRALVLSGGGARGAYQAGVLKYIGENIPDAHFETLVGTSSGAINVAGLATKKGKLSTAGTDIAKLWSELEINKVFRVDFISIFRIGLSWIYDLTIGGIFGRPQAQSLVDTSPLDRLLRKIYDPEAVADALAKGDLRSVAINATEVNTGCLVTFVQSSQDYQWQRARRRSKKVNLGVEHIMASSAIPILFPSALVENRRYVDGCIRSTSPLGPATRLGAGRILAIGVRRYYKNDLGDQLDIKPKVPERKVSIAQVGALVLNSLFSESLDSDAEHLERLNQFVGDVREGSIGMKKIEIMVIRPSQDLGAIAQDFQSRLPWLVRYLLRGLGSEAENSNDILSYLLFVPEYTKKLIELGYRDAQAEEQRLRSFFRK